MNKFRHLREILAYGLDEDRAVEKAQAIPSGILKARSWRMREIAGEMEGSESANYKGIQGFVSQQAWKSNLLRLYQEEAAFLIGDPTAGQENGGCWQAERWTNQWVLAIAPGHPLSRASHAVPFCQVFFRHSWRRSAGVSGRKAFGPGS